ncbi:substrate-binding domain-containing protein [Micromonospora sp. DT233]|uniref:substrate-binding domain-containing protein n=1 Tax=Micromonospora sp. DT233 TaxID=3393432 RepID=UPI003CFAC35D
MMSGRHRMRISLNGAGAVASATALAVVVAGAWFGYRYVARPSCSGQVEVSVAAATELAPAVKAAAARWMADGAVAAGTCVVVEVSAIDPVEVAAAMAGKHGVQLPGVPTVGGDAVNPDVWIPDSSTWLLRLKNAGAAAFNPTNGASVARSPVVVAAPEAVAAARFGWPDRALTWADLLQQINGGKPLRTGIVEPTRDAAGLSAVLSLTATADVPTAEQRANPGVLRALVTGRSVVRPELLARFPAAQPTAAATAEPTAITGGLDAAVLSEEDVLSYNERKPPVPLAAVYLNPALATLDYPYAVLPGMSPGKQAAAKALYGVLTEPAFRDRLAERSLRAPDGSWGAGFRAPQGAPRRLAASTLAGAPGLAAVDRAVSSWSMAAQPIRLLCVMDVSATMKGPVPSGDGTTRGQATVAAAQRGLSLFGNASPVGLWTFSTRLKGNQDHRELAPIKPLTTNRVRLQRELAAIRPTNGGTGLYDTMLAAYRQVQTGWLPDRLNSIVLFTAGGNDDDSGMSQQQLIAELKRIADPERPVPVVIIGVGQDVSLADLEPITKITGGGSFVTDDPARSGDLFLKAVTLRPDAPR